MKKSFIVLLCIVHLFSITSITSGQTITATPTGPLHVRQAQPINRPPILAPIGNQSVDVGNHLTFAVTATDPDNDPLTLSIAPVPLPPHMSFNSVNGEFSFSPDESQKAMNFPVTFSVSDGKGGNDSEAVTITVNDIPPGGITELSGTVLDTNDFVLGFTTPVVGATVSLLNTSSSTTTDINGNFLLTGPSGIPSDGQVLDIDTSTALPAPDGSNYAGFREAITLIANVTNVISQAVLLPRIDPASETQIDPNTMTTVLNPNINVSIDVAPHTAKNPNGTDFSGIMSISEVPEGQAPAPLPDEFEPGLLITIQPVGVFFATPVPITFPNTDNLPVGEIVKIWSLDPDTGRFVIVGQGEVKPSGMVETITGGIRAADWHFAVPQPPIPDTVPFNSDHQNSDQCDKCLLGSQTAIMSGNLVVDHELASYRSFGRSRSPQFIYNSVHANPQPVIITNATIPASSVLPDKMSVKLKVGGVEGIEIFTDTTSLNPNADETIRQAIQFDAANFTTGTYDYEVTLTNHFDATSMATTSSGRVLINNQIDSPFGAGWTLEGLQRLHLKGNGDVVLTDGNGSILRYDVVDALSVPVEFSVLIHHAGMDVGDFNSDGHADIVVASLFFPQMRLMFGDGMGGFTLSGISTLAKPSQGVKIGDFNNDNLLDVVVANSGSISNTIQVFLGDGAGNLSSPSQFNVMVKDPRSIVVGDFNEDGFDDVAVAGFSSSTPNGVAVMLGDGAGGFIGPTIVHSGVGITSGLSLADFNTDSYLDLKVDHNGMNHFHIFFGDGTGNFTDGGQVSSSGIFQSTTADFNQDNQTDVVSIAGLSINDFYVEAFFSDGNGDFFDSLRTPIPRAHINIFTSDLNNDNFPDIITCDPFSLPNFITLFLGKGTGEFKGPFDLSVSSNPNTLPNTISFGDFNEDGLNDVAVGNDANVSIMFSQPGALTTFISPKGDFATLVKNPDDTFTRTLKDGTQIHFDQTGLMTSRMDRNGNTITYSYDAQGRLQTITDPVNQVTTLAYGVDGLLETVLDPSGRTTIFTHNARGNLVKITDPDLTERRFTYDSRHRMKTRTDKRDPALLTAYDYNFAGRNIRANRPDGSSFEITPLVMAGLADLSSGVGTSANPAPSVLASDVEAVFTDGLQNQTKFQTDKFGASTKVINALNLTTTIDRNQNGHPTKITRPNGSMVNMTYDEAGNLLTVTEQAISATTGFTYTDDFNQVNTITDAENHLTDIDYDTNGNPTDIIDDAGTITKLEYTDANCPGLVTKVIAAFGLPEQNETVFTYYPADCNLHTVTDPLLHTTTFTYEINGSGNVKTVTDGEGKVTTFEYDAMNRLKKVTDANLKETNYTYDNEGNLQSVTDANNNVTQFDYEEMNRLETVTDPLLKVETYTYDLNGNLDTILDRKGQIIDFNYDEVNRLITKTLPGPLVTTYTYDLLDNLDTVTDPDSVLDFDYDNAGRLIRAKTTGSPLQPDVTLEYAYDKVGNRDTLKRQFGAGTLDLLIDYQFDNLNRIDTITNALAGLTVNVDHDVLSRRDDVTLPNNTTVDYVYDVASQLTQIVHKLSGTPFTSYNYAVYDNVGNRKQVNVVRPPSVANIATPLDYLYDNLYRLTDGTKVLTTLPLDEDYIYDPLGNRLRKQGQPSNSVFDAANRLLNDTVYTYQYDDNGNLLTKTEIAMPANVTTYTYDAENQLTRIDFPGGNFAEYAYDGLGRRIQKSGTALPASTRYVYDNEDVVFEYDGSNVLQARYTHGVGIDEPLVMERDLDLSGTFEATERFFYHTDGLGSIVDITDSTGALAQSYVYDAFGNIVVQNGTMVNPYAYTGREYDAESGLYYHRERYRDPQTGRFLQEDPVRGRVFNPSTFNKYPYVQNNPINSIDPEGEDTLEVAITIGLISVGIWQTINIVNRYLRNVLERLEGTGGFEQNDLEDIVQDALLPPFVPDLTPESDEIVPDPDEITNSAEEPKTSCEANQ